LATGYWIADRAFNYCRCLDDVDDEVRDRAALYLKVLNEQALADVYVREGSST
jgi:hypothetical protein